MFFKEIIFILISIILIVSCVSSGANESQQNAQIRKSNDLQFDSILNFKIKLDKKLNMADRDSVKDSFSAAELVFTVDYIESFVTITGWASDGYRCEPGEVLKGEIADSSLRLYLFHKSNDSKNIRTLNANDKLIMGFVKSDSLSTNLEGFSDKNSVKWNIVFIKIIK